MRNKVTQGVADRLMTDVVRSGICTGCGACVGVAPEGAARMVDTERGPIPEFVPGIALDEVAWRACPGKGVDYPTTYRDHYGMVPDSWLLGVQHGVRVGHATDDTVRQTGASGGVTTTVLVNLLETDRIDAAIVVKQGEPTPECARVKIARSSAEITDAAQSVYIPVSVLDILADLVPGERYAIVCLPEQAAALRVLQQSGSPVANQIKFVLGPYTGTALEPAAIKTVLKSHGVRADDQVVSLQWRAGEWPGHLRIDLESGRTIRLKKVYYNYLTPFFVTQTSLQSMDFVNEFADLSVGDAWAPHLESAGGGHSVFVTRSAEMEKLIEEMCQEGLLTADKIDPLRATEMHGHMLDFKKRGGYLRNWLRHWTGRAAPDYGLRPRPVGMSRVVVEGVIVSIFALCRTRAMRWLVGHLPERMMGPLFDRLRLRWKALSKPTKRKDLGSMTMVETTR